MRGKRQPSGKHKTIARLVEDAAVVLQRIVRMKAADHAGYARCVTCGKVQHWKEMDGGHFISRRYTSSKLLEENIHPQCKGCNGFRAGEHQAYTLYMIDTYGREFVDNLLATRHETKKYTRAEITERIQELKDYEQTIKTMRGF